MSNFTKHDTTYPQKEVTIHLLGNIAILIVFAVCWVLHRGTNKLVILLLYVSWLLIGPLYTTLKIHSHTTDDTRIDERDRQIEAEGIRDGLGLMYFGIFLVLVHGDDGSASMILNELFLIWILSRIVIDGKRLRIYAGHASWFPDSFGEWRRRRAHNFIARNRIVNPIPRQTDTAARFVEREKRKGKQ